MTYIVVALVCLFVLFVICAARQAANNNEWSAVILTDAASDCLTCLLWIFIFWLED